MSLGKFPKVLLCHSDQQHEPYQHSPFVGRLITPAIKGTPSPFTGIDNFAYTNWQPQEFFQLLQLYRGQNAIRWVACPDVVGNHQETLYRFEAWNWMIQHHGLPRAFVLQDGQPEETVPWEQIRAVFLGGSDDFKLSIHARKLCKTARRKGKWVHIGRVNSIKRVKRFLDIMHSFDGMSFSRFSRAHVPMILKFLEGKEV